MATKNGFEAISKNDAYRITMTVRKILLVQLFSNGDCLYATTIARQIKEDFPGCHLTWAIAAFCKDIIAGNPYIDQVTDIDFVPKSDAKEFRRYKRKMLEKKASGEFDEVFITQNMDTNQAYYDGCIRSCIFNAYPYPVKVPIKPVLKLTGIETDNAGKFAIQNQLQSYDQVILFEFAPQSGQLNITKETAILIAEDIVQKCKAAVILSSALPISHQDKAIIDGSRLTFRETAALTVTNDTINKCTDQLGKPGIKGFRKI